MTHNNDYSFLKAEQSTVQRFLRDLPEDRVIDRASFQNRLKVIEDELAELELKTTKEKIMTKEKKSNVVADLYLHVSNSGATIAIEDNGRGPEIAINMSTFGNLMGKIQLITVPQDLVNIGNMFLEAAKHEFSKFPKYTFWAQAVSNREYKANCCSDDDSKSDETKA